MNTITCKDPKLYSFDLKKVGRVKKIFWSNRGAYYRRGNIRVYFDTVMRLPYPYFYDDYSCHGNLGVIGGYEALSAFHVLYVEEFEDGEHVQLWEEC